MCFFDMGLLTDSRAGAGDGSARTGDVTRGRDHSTLCQPTRATWARGVHRTRSCTLTRAPIRASHTHSATRGLGGDKPEG